nr:Protein Y73B6BL.35 [Haemonchus contortus]
MQTAIAYLLAFILFVQCLGSSVGWAGERQDDSEQVADPRTAALRQMVPYRLWKRAHIIEPRALNQFKNCYFSPIQCVLMERRRR